MNICIINLRENNPYIGGVEKVSYLLGKDWVSKGHNVIFLSCYHSNISKPYDIVCKELFLPNKEYIISKENFGFFTNIIVQNKIEIIINQGSVFEECCKLCNYIKESTRVKLITTIHYSPLCKLTAIKNNFFIKSKLDRNLIDWLKDCLLCFRFHLFKKKESLKMEVAEYNTIAKCSDAIVSLSSSYLIIFQKLINPDFHKKLYAISNPIELVDNDVYEKKKQILYVGRLEYGMKRFDRMINIWAKIEKMFPDWSFVVIGDGPYRGYFENIVQKKGLKNVYFEGFQNPEKYYSESSIICLSSSTEGFGMVLVEALKYKCIPIAYNSFAALSDIIVDGVNGYAIPPFKEKLFIEKLHYLMSNENERMRLADNNAVTLHKFDINRVTQQWLNLFNNLLN